MIATIVISVLSLCYMLSVVSADNNLFFKTAPAELLSVPLGAPLELECEAAGSPSPTIHWLFNGNRLVQSENSVIEDDQISFENTPQNREMLTINMGSTKSKLIIECMTPEQAGDYTCVADVPTDRIAATSQVQVEYKGATNSLVSPCLSKRRGVSSPARIYMWTSQRLEVEGADVQLFCRATGYPTPTITWVDRMGNTLDKESDQYEVLDNGDLVIRSIEFLRNMGTYKCVAHNNVGDDEQGAFLYPTSLE